MDEELGRGFEAGESHPIQEPGAKKQIYSAL